MGLRTRSASFDFRAQDMPVRFGRHLLLKRRSTDPIGEEFLAAWGVEEGVEQLRVLRAIYPAVAEESQFIALFTEEARSLSRLAIANIVRVMEVGVESGIPYVACEHVEGVNLERLIELARDQDWPCSWEIAVHVATELLRGLDHVHRRKDILGKPMGMRHGDVRPANITVSYDGEIKLTNFGSALFFIADEMTNARVQTFRGIYAPPESSAVDEATVAADLWGVATILSALLGGRDLGGVATRVRTQESEFPAELATFFDKSLNRKPQDRFTDASSMREELLRVMQENARGHPPDDLAAWVKELAGDRRNEEFRHIRAMLAQNSNVILNEESISSHLGPGTVLDNRYHLLQQLGEGGMGIVFEAEHLGLGRKVAIKVLHERTLDDDIAVERFRREAQITGGLGHPNIIGVSDFGVTAEGHHYLVMDLLEGESLGDRISEHTLDPYELSRIMARVCDGLDAAHNAGVVHRDLKPENIFLTSSGPKIVDFGIAKKTGIDDGDQNLTRPGHICGTAEYLSPEQIRGEEPDFGSDVYAVGIMIYEGLTGVTPFRGRTLGETLHKVMSDKVVPPRKRNLTSEIPKRLESICLKAIARNPEKRFFSAAEMAEELRALLTEFEPQPQVPKPWPAPIKRTRLVAQLSFIVLSAAIAALVLLGFGDTLLDRLNKSPKSAFTTSTTREDLAVKPFEKVKPEKSTPAPKNNKNLVSEAEESGRNDTREPPQNEPEDPKLKASKKVAELVLKGKRELKLLHFDEASSHFEKALIIDPQVSEAWYGLGRSSFEQGRYADAAKKIDYALRLSPGQRRWRHTLGQIYSAMGQKEKAIREWKRILKTDPDNPRATRSLAQVEREK